MRAIPRASREAWAKLAQTLGIKVIHIAERDTQVSNVPKAPNEFVNTWSVDGFVSEGRSARRIGMGNARKTLSGGWRQAYAAGSRLRHLSQPAGREYARAHLDSRTRDTSMDF